MTTHKYVNDNGVTQITQNYLNTLSTAVNVIDEAKADKELPYQLSFTIDQAITSGIADLNEITSISINKLNNGGRVTTSYNNSHCEIVGIIQNNLYSFQMYFWSSNAFYCLYSTEGTLCSLKEIPLFDLHTPIKGVDYWTESDKAEIKAYVDNAILNGAW